MRKGTTLSLCTLTGTVVTIAVVAILLFAPGDTRAADAERGRLLYQNHCTVCHTSVVHVRERRKAASREDIQSWIRRWQKELDLKWGSTEVDDVTEFLNNRFYRLKTEG
jgi:cytochrome c5